MCSAIRSRRVRRSASTSDPRSNSNPSDAAAGALFTPAPMRTTYCYSDRAVLVPSDPPSRSRRVGARTGVAGGDVLDDLRGLLDVELVAAHPKRGEQVDELVALGFGEADHLVDRGV